MKKILKSKYIQALKKLILFSASTHLVILAIYAITNNDLQILNYFNIIDIDLFFPEIVNTYLYQALAVIIPTGIYVFFLIKRDKN